jgi:type IV secretory pathway TraG/TraD family ATPase VirD4
VLVLSLAALCVIGYVVGLLLWLSGQLAGLLTGKGWPDSSPGDVPSIMVHYFKDPLHPAMAWPPAARGAVGPAWLVLCILVILHIPVIYGSYRLARLGQDFRRRRKFRRFRLGFASRREVAQLLSAEAVLKKAKSAVPSSAGRKNIEPREVGFYLGRDIRSKLDLYASVEDVFVVLAPPRQGKDVHFCAPFTIDAPGPCIVTSTRADAFTNTYAMRAKVGRVHVFDPNDMTYWPERMRWSPVRGCENPITATRRANAFMKGAGIEPVGEAALFVAGATVILQGYFHAAAVGGRTLMDIQRWCSQQINPEPVEILRLGEMEGRSAPGWANTLEGVTVQNPIQRRGAMFANANVALACFSDPNVLAACSPGPGEEFDLVEFLSGRNTLYVLGKEEGGGGGVTPVVTAMMEDLFEGARKRASWMPGSRLDPPLTVELNEAAHIAPLPSLPGYMGDSGGFSIALHVYLQSLSQARARWGDHQAMIMWDNAAVRIIMGGAGNIADLEDISRLMGEFDEARTTTTVGEANSVAITTDTRRVLSAEEIRTLKFGNAVVVARASRPVEAVLTPWWERKDAKEIGDGKKWTEQMILRYGRQAMQSEQPGFRFDVPADSRSISPGPTYKAVTATPADRAQDAFPPPPALPPATGQVDPRDPQYGQWAAGIPFPEPQLWDRGAPPAVPPQPSPPTAPWHDHERGDRQG